MAICAVMDVTEISEDQKKNLLDMNAQSAQLGKASSFMRGNAAGHSLPTPKGNDAVRRSTYVKFHLRITRAATPGSSPKSRYS